MRQGIRRGCGEFTRDAPDGIGRDAGDAGRPFGRILATARAVSRNRMRVLRDELFVVQAFADDDIQQRQVEGQVGARADGQPFGGLGSGLGEARVEVDHFGAPVDGLAQGGSLGGGDGFHQVAAGQDDVLQVVIVAIGFFHAIGHQVGRRSWH